MTLSIKTFSIKTFSIMTFSIMTFSIKSFSIKTFSIMTLIEKEFSIMTLSIKAYFVTLSINETQYNNNLPLYSVSSFIHCYADCHNAEWHYAESLYC